MRKRSLVPSLLGVKAFGAITFISSITFTYFCKRTYAALRLERDVKRSIYFDF